MIILWNQHYYDTHSIEEDCGIIKIVLFLSSNRWVKSLIYHLLTICPWALIYTYVSKTSTSFKQNEGRYCVPHRVIVNIKNIGALAGVAQWIECWSVIQRVASLIPSQAHAWVAGQIFNKLLIKKQYWKAPSTISGISSQHSLSSFPLAFC